jgi:hypothetical protein
VFILYQVKNTLQASQKIQILVNVFPNILPDEFKDEIGQFRDEMGQFRGETGQLRDEI